MTILLTLPFCCTLGLTGLTLTLLKQVLSSSTHSGGECSVSTILYLMALQVGLWFLFLQLSFSPHLPLLLPSSHTYQWNNVHSATAFIFHFISSSCRILTKPVPFVLLMRLIKAWTRSMNALLLGASCATRLALRAVHSTF